ncbi:uridine kinase family protein [Paenibacillus glycinis]|uniref:Phosphoribulokinase/uridine kinase domain-containing protein n=1 Tax=Paenibacillus glycinis TaxID=2697035 RepID=A0ABW9XKX4_9BACL|nr:hypothetical protein [Paenibacillus glycinis]NBD23284.1 hypothetical protein [Paenibacillus glycinis]
MEQNANDLHATPLIAARALADEIDRRRSKRVRPFVVALDGGSGAGKTTLAILAAPLLGAALVHYDDFFDAAIADEEWDRSTAEQRCRRCMDWRRARREALLPLLDGRPACYRPFSFETADRLAREAVTVPPADVILLEGIYANLPGLSDLIDLSVLVHVPADVRTRRHNERENGEDLAWHGRWDAAEAYYFARIRPPSSFDLVLNL